MLPFRCQALLRLPHPQGPHPFTLRLVPDQEHLCAGDQLLVGGKFGGYIRVWNASRTSDIFRASIPLPASDAPIFCSSWPISCSSVSNRTPLTSQYQPEVLRVLPA